MPSGCIGKLYAGTRTWKTMHGKKPEIETMTGSAGTGSPGGAAQRAALALLKSWLTRTQRRELTKRREVTITGSSGGRYRLRPMTGACYAVERHGSRLFACGPSFCLHDPERILPPADVSLAHLLMLRTDEPGFLAAANHHANTSLMWNSEWLRRRARLRRDPEFQRELAEARQRVVDGERNQEAA